MFANINKIKSYGRNYNATVSAYQEFGAVAKVYMDLLDRQRELCSEIDAYNGPDSGSYLAEFKGAE
ncbi:MAG: hypothetical protein NE327_01135 [Lentisphaeraceae bacterium]|nr:hypothetical protein [Lentisphaeraceae bacterium]